MKIFWWRQVLHSTVNQNDIYILAKKNGKNLKFTPYEVLFMSYRKQKTVFPNIQNPTFYPGPHSVKVLWCFFLTSMHSRYRTLPPASHHNNRTRSRYQIYTPECEFEDLSLTKKRFSKASIFKKIKICEFSQSFTGTLSDVNAFTLPHLHARVSPQQ